MCTAPELAPRHRTAPWWSWSSLTAGPTCFLSPVEQSRVVAQLSFHSSVVLLLYQVPKGSHGGLQAEMCLAVLLRNYCRCPTLVGCRCASSPLLTAVPVPAPPVGLGVLLSELIIKKAPFVFCVGSIQCVNFSVTSTRAKSIPGETAGLVLNNSNAWSIFLNSCSRTVV